MTHNPLQDRVAVVTGASSGIGAAVARALAGEGARVALAARRKDRLLSVQSDIETRNGAAESLIHPTDVTDRTQVQDLMSHTESELGPVDILVNCAGVMYYTMMKNLHEDEWERTVDVCCKGLLHCVGATLTGMLSQDLRVISSTYPRTPAGRSFRGSRSTLGVSSLWRRSRRVCGWRRPAPG